MPVQPQTMSIARIARQRHKVLPSVLTKEVDMAPAPKAGLRRVTAMTRADDQSGDDQDEP